MRHARTNGEIDRMELSHFSAALTEGDDLWSNAERGAC